MLIGITTYGRNAENRFHLPAEYVEAVRSVGAVPILLPPGEENLSEFLRQVDAVIFAGGGDIDPAIYQQPKHKTLYNINAERDNTEFALMQLILAQAKPTLAICRGMQVLNVALGGDLHQHIPDQFGETVLHRWFKSTPVKHNVNIQPDSRLAADLQTTRLAVSSLHHQAINRLGDGLQVCATAEDGVIEAVADPNKPWLRAVQWHPELDVVAGDLQQRVLFRF